MEDGSPSGRPWVDEANKELPSPRSLSAGSPGLGLNMATFFGSPLSSHDDRVAFSNSKGYSGSEPPTPSLEGKGKVLVVHDRRCRRKRRHRHR